MAVGDEIPEALGAHWCERADLPETWDIVEELAEHASVPRPTLWLWDIETPNAMATGDSPQRSTITVTSGLLDALDGRELRSVLAHEMGHVVHGDVAAATEMAYQAARQVGAVAATASAVYVAASCTDSVADDWIALIAGTIFTAAAKNRAERRIAEFSRQRELAADAYAVTAGGSARALASSLAKLDVLSTSHGQMPPWLRLLLTADTDPLATHPPIPLRIAQLGAAAHLDGRVRTCPKCRFGEDVSSSHCRRCGTGLLDLTCDCGSFMDLEDKFCAACGTPARQVPCRRCGSIVHASFQFCGSCGQPQSDAAIPLAQQIDHTKLRPGESFTMTRAGQREVDQALQSILAPGEHVEECIAEARFETKWSFVTGTLVVTSAQVLFVKKGAFKQCLEWVIPRHALTNVSPSHGWRSGKLALTAADGQLIKLDGFAPKELAYAIAARLTGVLA